MNNGLNQQTRLSATTTTTGVTNQSQQSPQMAGQMYGHGVEQGQGGNPYFPGAMGYNPYIPMAWIPLGDRMINVPVFMLEPMRTNLTPIVQRSQDNNMTVALSVLQSAVFCFLQFEKAFKSFLSKGDDNTQLYNLSRCIGELEQANASQQTAATAIHSFGWLVTDENPLITNTRELFEHCIKVIKEFTPCLGGRVVQTYTHEKPLQLFTGWRGWQQQAEQIRVSNQALGKLLQKFLMQDPDNAAIYKEILCFQQSVNYTLDCFALCQYPKQKAIQAIYKSQGFEYITEVKEFYHTLEAVQVDLTPIEEETTNSQSGGLFSSIFGSSQ